MKRLICLLAAVFMLSGCSDTDVSISAPSTTETTAPTEATQGPLQNEYTLAADSWYTEPSYLSSEEYFSVERRYYGNGAEWLKFDEKKGRKYSVQANEDGLAVVEEITGQMYLIPDSFRFGDAEILCADGKALYIFQNNTVYRLEMTTGQEEVLFTGNIIRSVPFGWERTALHLLGDLVLYYATFDNGVLTIGRLYLPDGTNAVLSKQEVPVYDFYMQFDETASCNVTWRMFRPEFVAAVCREWSNPESPYKAREDLSKKWGTEEGLKELMEDYLSVLYLQEALGERALMEYTYHGMDNTVTTRVGVMCSCLRGSDMGHDHYAPDENTVPKIEASIGKWKAGSADFTLVPKGESSADAVQEYCYGDETGSMFLYTVKDGIYTKQFKQPLVAVIDTGSCFICQTQDDRIFGVSYNGTKTAQLYKATCGGLRQVWFDKYETKDLCILDGNTIVQYDLKKVRYRELVTHDYITYAKFSSYLYDKEQGSAVFFSVVNGMYSREVFLHLETGEIIIDYWL